ncbi:MAG TPA: glycosyl hydrolase 53 family protein [Tepidisphaeraceae bacterium]|jgi:arabinogalactan endo-1,4-beta-galactosidase|nr:glycosyl hydrolase 53 family protein [Tepidisphaeraceae bacterium]
MMKEDRITRREFGKIGLAVGGAMVGASLGLSSQTLGEDQPTTAPEKRKQPYILGADVSWIPEDEASGATYWDRGAQKDPLAILKSYDFNFIRARIFVNPHAAGGYSARREEAFCDLEHTKKWAKRIQEAGMGFLLSCHYSDTWASPGHQTKPAAWADLPFNQLVDTVHGWTAKVLKELKENGTPPQMVSIGNETSDGMLFPDGKISNFDNFAKLTNAGCLAVREFDAKVPVALHNHLGRDNAAIRKWVDGFLDRKTEFDIIGMSCYNQGHEGDWETNFNDLATRYPKLSFVAMECSYQKRFLNDLIFKAPNEKGLGSFIWEPMRWREAIFDHNGVNAGNDMNGRPHLAASTLPATGDPNQPVYRAAKPTGYANNDPDLVTPATRPARAAATQQGNFRGRNGGRYDTNSYILAYPEMAKAYGVV